MYGYFFDNIPRHEMFDLKLFKNVFDVFPSVQKKKKNCISQFTISSVVYKKTQHTFYS